MCIGLRDYDVWKLTCCSLSSQLFSSQKLSWEGVLGEGSRPFFNRHGATVYMQRYQKCFSHNYERNGRTTLIVNIKVINFVGLHVFSTCIPIQGNLIFPDLSFSTYSIKDSEHKNTFLHKLRLYLLISFHFCQISSGIMQLVIHTESTIKNWHKVKTWLDQMFRKFTK